MGRGRLRLSDLIRDTDCRCVQGSTDVEISALAYDSRKVVPDALFVCIAGARSDGHRYVAEALGRGAAAVVTERDVEAPEGLTVIRTPDTRLALAQISAAWFGHPAKELVTIGITGTKGKTTTAYMVRSVLESAGISTGLIGTIETIVGKERVPAGNTTPESYIVQETFRKMADAGCTCVVMEVSSQGLKMHRTGGFLFDYGIFTNLEPDHIGPDEHPDLEDYMRCKSLLFRQCRHGILNADDAHLEKILAGHTCEVETFGFCAGADLRAGNVRLLEGDGMLGVSYHVSGRIDLDVEVDIPGKFSVYNSLTALAVCRRFPVKEELICRAMKQIRVRGRVEILPISPAFTLLIDYAHNAMSLESLLSTLREYRPRRLVVLFGCGGNRARDRRFRMGEVSARLADVTIVTSDNPRWEDPKAITDDILTGAARAGGKCLAIEDRGQAVRYAIEHARRGDVIVLAGKGHEDYQEIRGKKYPMDDRELVKAVVKDGNFVR